MESAIDSSFFWGYLVTQIPGGFLASFFPANRIFGAAIVGSAFCNMFIPIAIYLNPIILILVRVLQGLVEVSIYLSIGIVLRKYNPFILLGCHISSMSWYLAILGTTIRTFSFSNNCIQWIICWCCNWPTCIWFSSRSYKLASPFLFLQHCGFYLVNILIHLAYRIYYAYVFFPQNPLGLQFGCG